MIKLDEEVAARIAGAIESGNVLTASYVELSGRPHISFYGSTHVHELDQLAIWVRKPDSPLLETLPEHPFLAFLYGDVSSRVYYTFEGRGRVSGDARERVYAEMHPIEQKFDPEMKGTAVIVDLDRFTSLSAAGKIVQER